MDLKKTEYGRSVKDKSLEYLTLTEGPRTLLLMAGVHGDEIEGLYLVDRFIESQNWKSLEGKCKLVVIPRFNPDGCSLNTRQNANGVDLNRNMPTKDWDPVAHKERYNPGPKAASEPETQAFIKLVESLKPHFILSAHTWNPVINYNGPCKEVAEVYAKYSDQKISDDIGYPTPGSHGTYLGWENLIPTITLEIEDELEDEKIWKLHSEALLKTLEYAAQNEKLG